MLRAEPGLVAADRYRREGAPRELVADTRIARGKITVDDDVIPALGVSDVVEHAVVVLAPEERDGVEALVRAEDVASGGLTLPLRCDRGLHTIQLARDRVRVACHVACRKDAVDIRAQILVDDDSAIDGQAG